MADVELGVAVLLLRLEEIKMETKNDTSEVSRDERIPGNHIHARPVLL